MAIVHVPQDTTKDESAFVAMVRWEAGAGTFMAIVHVPQDTTKDESASVAMVRWEADTGTFMAIVHVPQDTTKDESAFVAMVRWEAGAGTFMAMTWFLASVPWILARAFSSVIPAKAGIQAPGLVLEAQAGRYAGKYLIAPIFWIPAPGLRRGRLRWNNMVCGVRSLPSGSQPSLGHASTG